VTSPVVGIHDTVPLPVTLDTTGGGGGGGVATVIAALVAATLYVLLVWRLTWYCPVVLGTTRCTVPDVTPGGAGAAPVASVFSHFHADHELPCAPAAYSATQSAGFPGPPEMVTEIVDPAATVIGPDDPLTCTVGAAWASAGHSAMRKRTLARNTWVLIILHPSPFLITFLGILAVGPVRATDLPRVFVLTKAIQ
jgi:hypothetical protein